MTDATDSEGTTDPQGSGGLTGHPLIVGLAVGLDPNQPLIAATRAAIASQLASTQAATPQAQNAGSANLAGFADPDRAEVVMFAGYLGPSAADPEDKTKNWWFLYLDENATSWLLVPGDAIVLHQRAPDKKAAFQLRDVIWVRADAPVRQGDEAESRQSRFLIGTFTRAGDLHASLSDAGPLSPASGILCAPTPQCCGRHSK